MTEEQFEHEYNLEKLQVITPKKRDFKMLATPRFVSRYCEGVYEDFTCDLLLNLSKGKMLFIDIGAHYGYYTLLVGTKHPDCKIIAFEPVPENFEILKQNVALNQLKNTELHNLAISDSNELRKLEVTEASDTCSFYGHPWSATINQIDVRTVRLEDFLAATPTVPIIIKMDTEGHEPHILQGMKNLLKNSEDIKLIIEFNPKCLKNAGYAPEAFLKEVSDLDFDIYAIDDNKRLTYKLAENNFGRCTDYLPGGDEDRNTNLLCLKKQKSLSVCFFSHSAGLYGAERSLLELVTELVQEHGAVCPVILPGDGPLKQRLEEVGAATYIADYSHWFDPKVLPEEEINVLCRRNAQSVLYSIGEVIAKINPDVVVTNTMVIPWGAITASFLGKPHVWFIREFGEADHGLKPFMPFSATLDFIKALSDLIITNSEAVRRALFPDESSDKVFTIYPYVTIPEAALRQQGSSCFTRATSAKLVVSGPVHDGKGQKDAVLAARELVRRGKDVELIVIGDCSTKYAEHLKAIVRDENLQEHVKFIGFTENPYPIVNQADIVLVCSRNEAFGRVTVEGMLLKKPVIGTDSGGTPELIKDGTTGLLYRPGDHKQLADRIEYLIEHGQEARRLAENGYAFAKETFTKSKFGGRVYELLKELKTRTALRATSLTSAGKRPTILEGMLTAATMREPKTAGLVTELGSSLFAAEARISELEAQIQQLETQVRQIQHSIPMQLARRFQGVLNRLAPAGTRRRRSYELILTGIRVILNEGWKSFFRKVKAYLRRKTDKESKQP